MKGKEENDWSSSLQRERGAQWRGWHRQGQGQCVVAEEMGTDVSSELSLLSAVTQTPSQHCREAEDEGWELEEEVSGSGSRLGKCTILASNIAAPPPPPELRDDELKQVQREREWRDPRPLRALCAGM